MPAFDKLNRNLCIICTFLLLLAGVAAALYTGENWGVFHSLSRILFSPAKAATDYFLFGSPGAAFLNAGLCGLCALFAAVLLKAEFSSAVLAGFFLIIAHGFYGKNILNICFCGVIAGLFFVVMGRDLRKNLHLCMLTTCFGPLISELLFRYFLTEYDAASPVLHPLGLAAAAGMSVLISCLMPVLFPAGKKVCDGNNLYNAGLVGGVLGLGFYAFLYVSRGREAPEILIAESLAGESAGPSLGLFSNLFFLILFSTVLIYGWKQNGRSFDGYRKLLDSGTDDLMTAFGSPLCMINFGIYGLLLLLFYDLVILSGEGPGFSGPTVGALIAGLSFSFSEQKPNTVWPMAAGFLLFNLLSLLAGGRWMMASQPMLSSLAFATGLCPIVRKRGFGWGILAGFLCAFFCRFPALMHGGLMVYNGGFAAGIAAIFMTLILAVWDMVRNEFLNNLYQ